MEEIEQMLPLRRPISAQSTNIADAKVLDMIRLCYIFRAPHSSRPSN